MRANFEKLQAPFDFEEFVERLAWRVFAEAKKDHESFDPEMLYQTFAKTIK